MSKTLSFLRLDLITIRPYLTFKNLLLLLAVGAFVIYGTQSSSVIIGIVMVYGVIYASYPFAVGEQNGIDTLYCTLPVSRRHVVVGRYLYAMVISLCFGVASIVLSFLMSKILGFSFALLESLITAAATLAIFAVVLSLQLPLYFKLGYNKAKMVSYVPLMAFPMIVILVSKIGAGQAMSGVLAWASAHGVLLAAILAAFALACLAVSCSISIRVYSKRDL